MSDRNRVIVVGCGGIGKALLPHLCRYLNYQNHQWRVVLVDGDHYTSDNAIRQAFVALGNKAEVSRDELAPQFTSLVIEAVAAFVAGPDDAVHPQHEGQTVPVADLIKEGDTVMLCVDNHKTRLTVSWHCQTLKNVHLISGGNGTTDGNVQVYVRRNGKDLFMPIEGVHPEIEVAKSAKAPHEMSCEELAAAGTPQIYVANVFAATLMLSAFYAELNRANSAGEVFFTIVKIGTAAGPAAAPFERKPSPEGKNV